MRLTNFVLLLLLQSLIAVTLADQYGGAAAPAVYGGAAAPAAAPAVYGGAAAPAAAPAVYGGAAAPAAAAPVAVPAFLRAYGGGAGVVIPVEPAPVALPIPAEPAPVALPVAGTCQLPAARSAADCTAASFDACGHGVTTYFVNCRSVFVRLCTQPQAFADAETCLQRSCDVLQGDAGHNVDSMHQICRGTFNYNNVPANEVQYYPGGVPRSPPGLPGVSQLCQTLVCRPKRPVCSADDDTVCRREALCKKRQEFLERRLFRCADDDCSRRHLSLLSPVRRACKRLRVECKFLQGAVIVRRDARELQERLLACPSDDCRTATKSSIDRLADRLTVLQKRCLFTVHARGAILALEHWTQELANCGADDACRTRVTQTIAKIQKILTDSRDGLTKLTADAVTEWKTQIQEFTARKCADGDCACNCEKKARVVFFQTLLDESDRRHRVQTELAGLRQTVDKARADFRACHDDACRKVAREGVRVARTKIHAAIVSAMERERIALSVAANQLRQDAACQPAQCSRVTEFVVEKLDVKADKVTPAPCDCHDRIALMEKRASKLLNEADARLAACKDSEDCKQRLQAAIERVKSRIAAAKAECDIETTTPPPPGTDKKDQQPKQSCSDVCRSADENAVFECLLNCDEKNPAASFTTTAAGTTKPGAGNALGNNFAASQTGKNSSAGGIAGIIVGVVVGSAVAAGICAVAIGFFLTQSAASASAPLTQSLMTSAHTSPLYMAEMNTGSNPLF